ncbi:MAG: hypothetical protein GYB26_12315 [Gammaproteobacteria bacterium]|nr:hypothetical protein [Gammaproteobacteria bacterium]
MGTKERALRVGFTIVLVIAGVWMLNHSFYAFWLSDGPPNDYPAAWRQQGIISAWSGIAFLFLSYCFQFRLRKLWASWAVRVAGLSVLAGLSYPHLREWLLIDQCLDSGGKWLELYFECQAYS